MMFNKSISGKYYTAVDESALLYDKREDGTFAGSGGSTQFGTNRVTVLLTGYQTTSARGALMSQTMSGEWIDIADGWNATGESVQYSPTRAQELVDKITTNNAKIITNNLLCARFANKLSGAQKRTLYELQSRLETRNNSLIADGLVTVKKTAISAGYAELQGYLQTFMMQGAVGSITVAIVITAVVIAALSTAAYFAYKYYADESEQDVKFSDELTRTLVGKLTDEEYAQLKAETRGLVTKAALKARFGKSKLLVYAGLGLLAAGAWMYINKHN